eukprot:Unigene680_Nuclearia_a/m.2133 Unigene680_Nuclearia_a/g.2133  ORF Unigene680_Nuclearia_a/g.2133 Unigene680_Nuclearia_a/m.2133 type:complete len:311 (+) Unigene680_Nuclearia_a:114-1046(+)
MQVLALVLLALAGAAAAQTNPRNTIVENALELPQLSTLVSIVASPGYENVLAALNDPRNNLTLFAPSNDAFAKLPAVPEYETLLAILYYHVLGVKVRSTSLTPLQFPPTLMANDTLVNLGDGVPQVLEVIRNNNGVQIVFGIPGSPSFTARVTQADIDCSNGIIHIVDLVLLIPPVPSVIATEAGLSELVAALSAAGLVEAVNSLPSITIFAPTNEAFQAVGWRSLPIETLTQVLLYHVVPDAVAYSNTLTNGLVVKTLQGSTVRITLSGGGVQVNNANVALPDVLVSNGVVHVIDEVLIPTSQRKYFKL